MYKKLCKYLANLNVLNVKLHNIHWNVVGPQFTSVHNFTEEAYDTLFGYYDDVAEILKMRGHYPHASLAKYLEATSIKEIESEDIGVEQALKTVSDDFDEMLELAFIIRREADEQGDVTLVSTLEDQIAYYQKNLWFIKSMLTKKA